MTYRITYNGSDVEATTLDAAIEYAKSLIAEDAGTVVSWTVEHDEVVNDWFVQGSPAGSELQFTATVAGPEPVAPIDDLTAAYAEPPRAGDWHDLGGGRTPTVDDDRDDVLRRRSFAGATPTEVFGDATAWLAGQHGAVDVADLGWRHRPDGYAPLELTIYYHPR